MSDFKFPTEEVELPSKGLLYPESNPLSSGKVELKYMTAREEDILSNQSYIQKGIVLDKLLRSLIVNKDINIDDLVTGDKNAIFIASRILGYGKDYNVSIKDIEYTLDLTKLENKDFDESFLTKGTNLFSYTMESTGTVIEYKILTGRDEKTVDREIEALKKINKDSSTGITSRLKQMIVSVDGKAERKDINNFVDNYLLARDSRALREHIKNTQPDVDMNYILDNGEEVAIPIGLNFFWPEL